MRRIQWKNSEKIDKKKIEIDSDIDILCRYILKEADSYYDYYFYQFYERIIE